MVIVRETSPNVFEEMTRGNSIVGNGATFPWQIVDLWSDAELAALDVYKLEVPDVPEGKLLASYSVERVNDVVSYVPVYEDIPGPEPMTLIEYAANARWMKEVGGVTVGGIPVATDDRSKQMILGARVAANGDPDFTTPWVGANGDVYPLDAATVIAISDAVLAHVASCFSIYATVKTGIDNETITTNAQIDAAFA